MTIKKQTPVDFLIALRAIKNQPYAGSQGDEPMLKIHREQGKKLGIEGIDPAKFFDDLFTGYFETLISALPAQQQIEIKQRIAVGTLEHEMVNAQITRSLNGRFFAILINRALIVMANKYLKLVAAARHPVSVQYCNGISPSHLHPADYIELGTQMLLEYGRTGKPIGPDIKLALKTQAMGDVETSLTLFHMFVLAHEIGHYVNGDLGKPANFRECDWNKDVTLFPSNPSHAMEFKADEFAFQILLKVLARRQPSMPALQAFYLSALATLNFLRDISNRGSESHPKPSDRIMHLTKQFFGAQAAELMESSFTDVKATQMFRSLFGLMTISEILASRNGK